MKVGILGGSFNPPHAGHIHISKLALKKLGLNQVWWIVAKQNPLKENHEKSYEKRLNLCAEILQKERRILIQKSDEIYSYKLLENLQKKFPQIEFFWIMGGDNLENLHKWKNYRQFIKSVKIAIFSREKTLMNIQKMPAWNFLKNYKPQIFWTENLDISSTKIRNEELYN